MPTLNLAFLLLAALISRELGTRMKAAIMTFLSVLLLSACGATLLENPTAPPDAEPSPAASVTPAAGPTSTAYAGAIDPPVVNCVELLTTPWTLSGAANEAAQPETFQSIDGLLQDSEVLQVIIDVHGASFAEGEMKDESAIMIDQPDGQPTAASLAAHGLDNGQEGVQAVYIPLEDFIGPGGVLDLTQPYGPLHARFWNETGFTVEISSIQACNYQRV